MRSLTTNQPMVKLLLSCQKILVAQCFLPRGCFYGACCSMTSALCLCHTILLISSAVIASAFAITTIISATFHLASNPYTAADTGIAQRASSHPPTLGASTRKIKGTENKTTMTAGHLHQDFNEQRSAPSGGDHCPSLTL